MSKGIIYTPRVRKSPFFEETIKSGATNFTTYNHMTMPVGYTTPEQEYHSLINDVTLWDVAAERQVEVVGEDAAKFVQYMTPRNLSTFKDGFCRYAFMTDENGGIINDPLILKFNDNKFWLSIADSDAILWCKGVALSGKFNVKISEPEACPLSLQGPRSKELIRKVTNDDPIIMGLKYYQFIETNLFGIDIIIARSGWSNQFGYEIYITREIDAPTLWNSLMDAGKEFRIVPSCPNQIDRIEAGMISHQGDTSLEENPLELNLPKFYDLDQEADFVGKEALLKIREEGIKKQFTGFKISGKKIGYNMARIPLFNKNGEQQGFVTSTIYSPNFGCNIALGYIDINLTNSEDVFNINHDGEEREVEVVPLPFSSRLEKME
ncbi:glycine cleavage system protein T [Pelagibacteraceae bacterium]|jgi:glycine cleavage system aminomethyltransferase T|nr:glycine cleavage system protein T [Pelagibacteraceae bacterium]|tara:strand:- start:450 stop:1586 length:1137 start_codon:yes stop_codon:yes gene_type:complete